LHHQDGKWQYGRVFRHQWLAERFDGTSGWVATMPARKSPTVGSGSKWFVRATTVGGDSRRGPTWDTGALAWPMIACQSPNRCHRLVNGQGRPGRRSGTWGRRARLLEWHFPQGDLWTTWVSHRRTGRFSPTRPPAESAEPGHFSLLIRFRATSTTRRLSLIW
jgi:hypothetical protein